jgi:hypothetical protein
MSAASLAGALPGVPDRAAPSPIDPFWQVVDDLLLNRAGKVWRALWKFIWPDGDFHPTVTRIAELARISVSSVKRGLKELAEAGKLLIELDMAHPVGRRIAPAVPLPIVAEGGVSPEPPGQFCPVNSDPSYVERKSASAPHVQRGAVTSEPPPSGPLTRTLARLESDPGSVEDAVAHLVEHFGKGDEGRDFTPFYRKACRDAARGKLAIGDLIGAVEESERDGARSPRRAFIASVKARQAGKRRVAPTDRPADPGPPAETRAEAHFEPPAPDPSPAVVIEPTPAAVAPPTDEELRWYTDHLGADDGTMFLFAFRALRLCGREDLITPKHFERAARIRDRMVSGAMADAKRRTGRQPLAGLPAGPKSPCRPPG